MISLDTTTRKLQAFLSGAAATTNPTVSVWFYEVPNQAKLDNSEYRRAPQFTVLAGTAETDICDAPAQGVVRNIDSINIYNTDSATVTVTVCVDDNGTNRILAEITLLTKETAAWSSKSGDWQLIT